MRIACVSSSRVPSTTANSIQVMKVCQSLAQTGAEVTLWTPGKSSVPWVDLAATYGLSTPYETRWIASLDGLKRYDFALQAVRQALGLKSDLIYTWLPQAALLGLQRGVSVVLEVHDRPTGRLGLWLLRRVAASKGRKKLAVITRALQKALETEFGIKLKPEEVVIAPNGADLERYDRLPDPAAARKQLNLPDRITAVYTGHFYAGRGMDMLLGMARLFPQAQFLWVGGNPDSIEQWRGRIAHQGIENIHLTGFIENQHLPFYQAAGDILLMPYETSVAGSSGGNSADICSPMKMFEYLACGRAILTSDLPVLHEVLNNENAVFCQPEDLTSWQAALTDLLADPQRLHRLGHQARLDAGKYTWKLRAQRVLAGFE